MSITPLDEWMTPDNWTLIIRRILPDDAALWLEFMQSMSPATRYKRGARHAEELTPTEVQAAVTPDADAELALVAIAKREGRRVIAGVARCGRSETGVGEFAVVVADKWQRRGVGRRLMRLLASEAARAGIHRLEGTVLTTNRGMLEFVERLGFRMGQSERGAMFKRVVQDLTAARPQRPEPGS